MKIRSLWVVLLLPGLLAASCGSGSSPTQGTTPHTLTLVNGIVNVSAGGWNTTQVNVTSNMQNPHVVGSFVASGGSGNDIIVLVMGATNYANWSNGHPVTPLYSSGQMTTASYDVALTAGTFYVVYDNTFSIISTKNVTTRADLNWEE